MIETLFDCIRTGDIESFREVLTAHLMTIINAGFAKKTGIGLRNGFSFACMVFQPSPVLYATASIVPPFVKSF